MACPLFMGGGGSGANYPAPVLLRCIAQTYLRHFSFFFFLLFSRVELLAELWDWQGCGCGCERGRTVLVPM